MPPLLAPSFNIILVNSIVDRSVIILTITDPAEAEKIIPIDHSSITDLLDFN